MTRGLEENAQGRVVPVTATWKGLLRIKDSTKRGPTAPPREVPLPDSHRARSRPFPDLRAAPPGCRPGLPRPPQAPPGAQQRTTHRTWRRPGELAVRARGPRRLTRDVQVAQPLCLQGRPRGQLLPVPLHVHRKAATPGRVSWSLRLPARPYVHVACSRDQRPGVPANRGATRP